MESDLYKRIQNDISSSMKKRTVPSEALRLDVLRMLLSDIKYKSIEKKEPLEEADIIDCMKRAVKTRLDAVALYQKGGRNDLAGKEESEILILKEYLPMEFSSEELEAIVDSAISIVSEKPAETDKNRTFGMVMKEAMLLARKHTDKTFDGGVLSSVIRKKLG